MTGPVLETDRLRLRPHCLDDFANVAALWADPEVVKYISGVPSSSEESWSRLLRYIGHWQALDFGFWVVCDRADGSFLGEVGFANFQRQISPPLPEAPEAGWVLARQAHGRGIATEAVARIHRWADEDRQWSQTVAIFSPEHAASQHVAAKQGYEAQGTARYKGHPLFTMQRKRGALGG